MSCSPQASFIELDFTSEFPEAIDGSELSIDRLKEMGPDELHSTSINTLNGTVRLGDICTIRQVPSSERSLVIRTNGCRIDYLASATSSGTTVVIGDVGDHFAEGQTGGSVILFGNSGSYAGTARANGSLVIVGSCGDHLAGHLIGKRSGMRGGDLIVYGDVGNRALERMRRGTAFLVGSVGDYLAPHWIAGTILCGGPIGMNYAIGMRRGSLIAKEQPTRPTQAAWSVSKSFELSFLPLLWRHLAQLELSIQSAVTRVAEKMAKPLLSEPVSDELKSLPIPTTRWAKRCIGDLNFQGKGELLVLDRLSTDYLQPVLRDAKCE